MRTWLIAGSALVASAVAFAQAPAPRLTREQRTILERLVAAVDAAAAAESGGATAAAVWQTHLLRASDGSHYLATSILPEAGVTRPGPVAIYVRLATRFDVPPVVAERSAVGDWLRGLRSEPLPFRPTRVVTVPVGELPVGGASVDRTGASQAFGALALMEKQRERAREERERRERERRAELEGAGESSTTARTPLFPFEDFAMNAAVDQLADQSPVLRRSIVAGPGRYDLFVAIAEPGPRNQPGAVQVFRHTVTLPAASASPLALSSIVLGDAVRTLDAPYSAAEQTAHPYAFGAMEITPATDDVFTTDEQMAFAVQVINPRANAIGKPDVTLAFRLFRRTAEGEQPAATLTPQEHNEATLPVDFDLAKGHPLFAATSFPLRSLTRGEYRLEIVAADKVAGAMARASATFRVAGTPASLLAEAPGGPALTRDAALDAPVLAAILTRLRGAAPSEGLARLTAAAAERRFVDALRDEPVTPAEDGIRLALRGLALLALADPRAALAQLQRAQRASAPSAPVAMLVGLSHAIEHNDREALHAWETVSRLEDLEPAVLGLVIDAHLRLRDGAAALPLIERAERAEPGAPRWQRARALAYLHADREADAVELLEARLAAAADDTAAEFLLIEALYAGHVRGRGPGATPEGRARLLALGRAYAERDVPHAALVREWLGVLATASSAR
ncbi:MAG: hypothetical protein AB1635_08445 [Acidobacteriota bacterium]